LKQNTAQNPQNQAQKHTTGCSSCFYTVQKKAAVNIFSQPLFDADFTGAGDRDRTGNPLLGKQMRYHCATPAQNQTAQLSDFKR
jgi:hypothetical protein